MTVRPEGAARRGRRSAGVGLWLIAGVLACAGTKGRCQSEPATTTAASGGGETSGGVETGGGVEATSPIARTVDGDLRPLLAQIYGGAALASAATSDGERETIDDLGYRLGRAHTQADGDALAEGLRARGYAVDRALVDERGASIFAHGRGVDMTLQVDEGAALLSLSIVSAP